MRTEVEMVAYDNVAGLLDGYLYDQRSILVHLDASHAWYNQIAANIALANHVLELVEDGR